MMEALTRWRSTRRIAAVAVAVALSLTAASLLVRMAPAHAQLIDRQALSLEGAKLVVAAATAEARRKTAGGTIAVVDEGGNLMALERLDGTFAASATVAVGKARTAAMFQKPTKAFEEVIRSGRTAMVALNDFTPLEGGVPIVVGGRVVGAVGVSGANSAQQDTEIAQTGANAASGFGTKTTSAGSAITYLDRARVAAAFAKGVPLLEVDGYKVHASRRDGPGLAEVHDFETDVVYVLDGTALVVTGGTVVNPKVTEPGQIRGSMIEGGEARRVGKGDVVVIPAGVPHWFKEVPGPLTYFVVKPISMSGAGK